MSQPEVVSSGLAPEYITGIFTIVGAFVGAIATWGLMRKPEPRQEIRARTSPSTSIAVVASEFRKKVQLFVDQQEVKDPGSVTVLISNVGNRAVENIVMRMSVDAKAAFLAWQVQAEAALKEEIEITQPSANGIPIKNEVQLKVPLLNPGDAFELQFMTDKSQVELQVNYRQPNVVFSQQQETLISGALLQGFAEEISSHLLAARYFELVFPPFREWRRRREKLAPKSR